MNKLVDLFVNCLLFGGIIAVDRITKYFAIQGLIPDIPVPYVSCNLAMNRGISWGWLHTNDTQQFIIISAVIGFIILGLMAQIYIRWRKNETIWPFTLVVGGAVSNMFDRILFGGVIDFIEVSCSGWSWPVFNIADVSIVVGIICIVIQELRK